MVKAREDIFELPGGIQTLLDARYARTLGLSTVFALQVARIGDGTEHNPEEIVFRSVHTICELWLRLAGFELERALAAVHPELPGQQSPLLRPPHRWQMANRRGALRKRRPACVP